MDLKRALKTIDEGRLIKKLKVFDIKGKVLSCLRSYINNRYQKVKLDVFSKKLLAEYGVPQGSVVGPVLFILHIDDIIRVETVDSIVKLLADDTMIFVSGESANEIEIKLNSALHGLERWLNVNKLKMNTIETKYMIVRSVRKELSREIAVSTKEG